MNGAMAEALAAAEGEQDIEKKVEQALACPCLGDLKDGPCGPTFVHAFGCFIRSEHEDKGMDCLEQFKQFQVCLQKHPEHVARIMEDEPPAAAASVAAAATEAAAAAPAAPAAPDVVASAAADVQATQQAAAAGAQ